MKFPGKVGKWANEQMVKFWWRSRTDLPDGGTDIATLVRRALAEVYTVPVLLVITIIIVNQYTFINYYSIINNNIIVLKLFV